MVRCSRASADFDLGFERARIETIWQVEIDPYATKVLAKHWPNVRRYADIATIEWGTVPRPDIISGGFPCQDISLVGTGKGLLGTRSGLWHEQMRVVRELRPRYVVVENTPGLYTRGLGQVLSDLATAGYDAEWQSIFASDMGAPHRRERVFIVAYPQNEPRLQANSIFNTSRSASQTRTDDRCVAWSEMASPDWILHQSYVTRTINGIPRRVERAKCLGNAVVPQIAELIGRMIVVAEARR